MSRLVLGAMAFLALVQLHPIVSPRAHADGVRLVQGWDQLSPADRQKAQDKYHIYKKMPPSRQQEIQRSYREWQGMRPAEKEAIRRNYQTYRELSPQQRRAVGQLYQRRRGGSR